ncbi:MAG: c-type cytochrome biogenesis protein CcmF, partial [Zoogloeaceae bacterium]|nr:c-type cytochrome biogenesis protein CcmF [Zoogloeaceae bacterium]
LMGGGSFQTVSRETALLVNNVLLAVAAASVLLGTLYPLFVDALGLGKISVGPPYFEAVFVPLMVPVVLLMVVGPFIRWKGHALGGLARKLAPDLGVSLGLGVALAWATGVMSWRMVLGMALAAWVVIASFHLLKERLVERPGAPPMNRLRGIPTAWWGMWLAHLGISVFILGVTLVKGLESNVDVKMQPGDVAHLAGYSFTLKAVTDYRGPNFDASRADLEVTRDGKPVALLHPEKRTYRAAGMPMTEASIDVNLLRDIYASMGEPLDDKTWIVRLYYKPFISWIWIGCLMMAIGGGLAASDRRYRRMAEREAPAGAAARA